MLRKPSLPTVIFLYGVGAWALAYWMPEKLEAFEIWVSYLPPYGESFRDRLHSKQRRDPERRENT